MVTREELPEPESHLKTKLNRVWKFGCKRMECFLRQHSIMCLFDLCVITHSGLDQFRHYAGDLFVQFRKILWHHKAWPGNLLTWHFFRIQQHLRCTCGFPYNWNWLSSFIRKSIIVSCFIPVCPWYLFELANVLPVRLWKHPFEHSACRFHN